MASKNPTTMEGMIESTLKMLEEDILVSMPPRNLPSKAFEKSFGVVFLESIQVGFLFSAQIGTGILLRHDKETNTWSPPLAIGLTGVGVGFMMGAEKKHMVAFLDHDQMTEAMASDFSFRLGFDHSWALGIGTGDNKTAHIGNQGSTMMTGQSSTVGIYYGVSADGTALAPRTAVNEKFYGKKLEPKQIVYGGEETPKPECEGLDRLHAKLQELAAKTAKQK